MAERSLLTELRTVLPHSFPFIPYMVVRVSEGAKRICVHTYYKEIRI